MLCSIVLLIEEVHPLWLAIVTAAKLLQTSFVSVAFWMLGEPFILQHLASLGINLMVLSRLGLTWWVVPTLGHRRVIL